MSEPDVSDLITVQRAIEIIDAAEVHPRTESIALHDSLDRILAQDIAADRDYPVAAKSLMDGFAVRASEAAEQATLRVVGEIRAGEFSSREIQPGETIAIMTGAPLPPGADGVVPIEFVQREDESVRINQGGDFRRFVALAGSDCSSGTVVLRRGMRLEAPQIAVAATVGKTELTVFARPRVAILATGDELVAIDQTPQPHQIRNSNSTMLLALLTRIGCEVTDLGVVPDQMPPLLDAIRRGATFDALFITGGMSVGAYDLPPKALQQLGADTRITKLRIKPGKPFIFGKLRECFLFGLPGNPLAGFVCTARLASRLLRRMMGADPSIGETSATLGADLPGNGPREFYQPAKTNGSIAQPLAWKSSADVFTLAQADALLIRPENDPPHCAGATCRLLRLP